MEVNFHHNKVDVGEIQFHTVSYGCKTSIISPPTANVYLIVIPLDGTSHLQQGKINYSAQKNDIFILPPGDDLEIELSESFKQLTIQIPEASFHKHIIEQLGRQFDETLSFKPFHKAGNVPGNSLLALTNAVISDLDTRALFNRNQHTAQHLENTFISLILDEFENNYREAATQIALSCRPRHIKRAEEYIRSNYQEQIHIGLLAKEIGITPRSLQMGFSQYLNTSPTTYIKNMRLKKAREHLTGPDAGEISITEIADLCGFNHLSNFAKYYKALFGETPSQTLRKRN